MTYTQTQINRYISKTGTNFARFAGRVVFNIILIYLTRKSGCYAPILLAPAEGWGSFGPQGLFRPFWGPLALLQ